MLPFSRRSRRCFYCQSFSPSQHQLKFPARWKCLKCDAVNHVDENGQPCDPPIEETAQEPASSQKYAIPPPDATTGYDGDRNDSIFCSTCLKNQFLIYESLSNYLPDESDPSYTKYEASCSAYRKELEELFPPVCKYCAPAAQRQIDKAQYFAKSDYLRRLMEQKDHGFFLSWNWRQIMLACGAAAHYISIAGQLTWDLMGILSNPLTTSTHMLDATRATPFSCISHMGFFWSRHSLNLDLLSIFSAPNITEHAAPPTPAPAPSQLAITDNAAQYVLGISTDSTAQPSTRSGFPFDKLRTQTPKSTKTRSVYSFNPSEAGDDPDAMDWTPLPKTIELNVPSKRPLTPKYPVIGDPFRAGLQQQPNRYQSSLNANGTFGFRLPGTLPPKSQPTKLPFAPPKFLPDDLQSVTGLESLFDKAFTIADGLDRLNTPKTTAAAAPTEQRSDEQVLQPEKPEVTGIRDVILFCLRQASLILAFLTFVFPWVFQWPARFAHFIVLGVLAVIPGSWMINSLRRSVESGKVVGILVTFAHLLIWLIFLAGHIFLPDVIKAHIHLDKVDMVVISVMFGREFQLSNLKAWLAPASAGNPLAVDGSNRSEERGIQEFDTPRPEELNEFNPEYHDRVPPPKSAPTPAHGSALDPALAPQSARAYTSVPPFAPTPEPVRRPQAEINFMFEPQYSQRRAGSGHSVEQSRHRGLGPTPTLQAQLPPTLRASSPLRTVREGTPSSSFPDPFSAMTRFPPPNESFLSLPENVLSPARSPTLSATTADTTISDPPSPHYPRYAHSTGMTPDPFIEELNLNEELDRSHTPVQPVKHRESPRYNLRKRYV
ncbi:hypothetical protein KEM54_005362 [Ascosphaera aggregata]|nr:hypothetical protein KEM54_005362 [Ascosphaera aggregata]